MKQTLAQLTAGQLSGVTEICISEQLKHFPTALFDLADTLEVLDLSHNQLNCLPDEFYRFKKLRILFLSNNQFESIPEVLAQCPELEMIGFRDNRITTVPEDALPLHTRWLILTDNKIEKLPDSMGKLYRLQKLALAGNRLTEIPASMANCKNLELARLSANALTEIPSAFLQLPKLAWLAIAGNDFNRDSTSHHADMLTVQLTAIKLEHPLGEGASGVIYKAQWLQHPASLLGTDKHIAVKIFKGHVTSDGYPADELANCLSAGQHRNLVKVIAQIQEPTSTGLVMELIPASFSNLGLPPSLLSCTRDTFAEGLSFSTPTILKIVKAITEAMVHLQEAHITHGDLYAHNTMIDDQANVLLGDFGAASNISMMTEQQQHLMQGIEVRAFGCLLDDLLSLTATDKDDELRVKLMTLRDACMQAQTLQRPNFKAISHRLSA